VKGGGVAGVIQYEFKRDVRKRGVVLLAVFTVLPLIVAAVVKALGAAAEGEEMLWAVMMGFDVGAGTAVGVAAGLGIAGWSWLVAVIYGGDMIASDLKEGGLRLIAVRPVGRKGYILGKLAALTAFLTIAFAGAGAAVALAAYLLGGPQERAWLAPILGALIGLGSLPIALTASLLGAATRNPVAGFILGAAAYLLLGAVVNIGLFITLIGGFNDPEAWARYHEYSLLAPAAVPLLAGPNIPRMLLHLAVHGNEFQPITVPVFEDGGLREVVVRVGVTPLEVLALYTASTLLGLAALLYLNYRLISRADVG